MPGDRKISLREFAREETPFGLICRQVLREREHACLGCTFAKTCFQPSDCERARDHGACGECDAYRLKHAPA